MRTNGICIIFWACVAVSMSYRYNVEECKCMCSGYINQNVCEHLSDLRLEIDANTEELKKWVQFFPFVRHLQEKWREEISSVVESEMKKYLGSNNVLPKPEYLVMEKEDNMVDEANVISRPTDGDDQLAKNVSNLLAKVEKVENRTMEVEEELKSERRVRRHLEQDLKETQSSLVSLEDQLQNVTVPVDALMYQMQTVVFSSLEDMNKTIYEDYLQKLYYKVDEVVYQNETKKLGERINHIEIELQDFSNDSLVMKLAEDVKQLEDNLIVLNSSLGNDINPRLFVLETETVKRESTEGLEQRIINNTELFYTVLAYVLDFRNFQEKMQNFSQEWRKSLETMQMQIEDLKREISENNSTDNNYVAQEDDFDKSVQVVGVRKFINLTDSSIEVIGVRKISDLNQTTDADDDDDTHDDGDFSDLVDVIEVRNLNASKDSTDIIYAGKVENGSSEVYNESTEELDDMNYTNSSSESYDFFTINTLTESTENETVTLTPEIEVLTTTEEVQRKTYDIGTCSVPNIEDMELLVDLENDEDNRTKLIFGCRSIGQYSVKEAPIPLRCDNGDWDGPFPSCQMLANQKDIEQISELLKKENPCLAISGEFADPTDCSRFFKCSHGTASLMTCPHNLHFNPVLQVCDYPKAARCATAKNELLNKVQNLIPPILIEPNNLDKPNGLMGTGTAGQLIVHPRSSFTLHCLYPDNLWRLPVWNVTYFRPPSTLERVPKIGTNRISLTITAAEEEDSGIYRCITPFGKEHSIRVVVKAVICPQIELEEDYEEVYYRPTPEGEQRILSTTAEFRCEEGDRSSVQCLANGNWSSHYPQNCTPKRRSLEDGWNCEPFDTSTEPNLILEKSDFEKIVVFKCASRLQLIGNSFTRCRDDGHWSHTALPTCIS